MSQIHFSEFGKGQPVVLIHGFCEIGDMWESVATALSSQFHVYYLDLPGFGMSPLAVDHVTLEEVAVMLEEWMDEQKIHNPFLIGHSLGGYVTLALLELMGSRIKGIGLVHSTAFADDEEKKSGRNKTITFLRKQGVEKFVTAFVPQLFTPSNRKFFEKEIELAVDQAKKSTLHGLIAFTKAMRDRKSRLSLLEDFKGPKLMIAGTEDGAVKIEASRMQQRLFTQYHELKGVGHMGQVERKDEVIEILRGFLNEN
ncbi:MAG: alpha/beta hydrolase [Algoriphagus sp.]|uniref:alpha/beta fold hydrolase n=1 Tax=Algoriphagus sp. TaxID=1872435 RepID=UPI002605F089|nr:alpha/beta hydrolase [Algoriphagus sp.]MDG1278211.1 alpha/beta hydrolase [Algoriphagus sp.]